jgi:replicative DNA helicase
MINTERILPHDIDAEEAVIGSIVIGGDIKGLSLKGEDFYSERNRWVYESAQRLNDKKISINQITLSAELGTHLENIGGAAYLSHMVAICPTSLDLPYYADIVQKLAIKRQVIEFSTKVADLGYNASGDLSEDFTSIDRMFLSLRKRSAPVQLVMPAERVRQALDRYDRIFYVEGGNAISTGLRDLDHWLGGGLMGGDFMVIGSRTGVGKTTIAQTIANNIAAKRKVLYVSVEMTTDDMTDRDVASYLGEPVSHIRRGNYEQTREGLYTDILMALEEYVGKLNIIHISGSFDTDKIHQIALSTQMRYGLDAVVVDYLGILKDRYGTNDEQRLSYISRNLKSMAMELKIPFIVPHQLNRENEKREDNRPKMSDLRGSGSIESDADIVILMYRENYYKRIQDTTTEVIIAKHRQGESNKLVKLSFDLKHGRYMDYNKLEDVQEELL